MSDPSPPKKRKAHASCCYIPFTVLAYWLSQSLGVCLAEVQALQCPPILNTHIFLTCRAGEGQLILTATQLVYKGQNTVCKQLLAVAALSTLSKWTLAHCGTCRYENSPFHFSASSPSTCTSARPHSCITDMPELPALRQLHAYALLSGTQWPPPAWEALLIRPCSLGRTLLCATPTTRLILAPRCHACCRVPTHPQKNPGISSILSTLPSVQGEQNTECLPVSLCRHRWSWLMDVHCTAAIALAFFFWRGGVRVDILIYASCAHL